MIKLRLKYKSGVYYGNIQDSMRSGKGKWYVSTTNGIDIYDGIWSDDYPNGEGFLEVFSIPHIIWSGTFKDGYANGKMTLSLLYMDKDETRT